MPGGRNPLPIREQLGLSQSQLAEQIGVSVREVQAWESGHRTPSRLAERAMELLAGKE